MIVVANFGMGNYKSVKNMINFLDYDCEIWEQPKKSSSMSHLILPGVGAFDAGMSRLKISGWSSFIQDSFGSIYVMGVCLGMHLLCNTSAEGEYSGVGLLNADVLKFDENAVRVPHYGWNDVRVVRDNQLINREDNSHRFYFTHSYYVKPRLEDSVLGLTNYGQEFASIVASEKIYGCQFHPEKSHKFGMQIYRNFVNL